MTDPLTLKILTILMKKNSSNFVSYVSLKNFLAHVTEVDSRTDTNADQKSEKLTSRRRFFKPSKKSRTKLFPSFANIQNPECNRKSQIEEQEANIFLSSSSRICPDLEENSLIPDIIFSSDGMYEPVEADEVSGFTIYTNSYVFKLYESLRKESSFITISKDKCNNGFTLFHLIPLNTNKMKGNFRFCPFASFTVIMISVEGTSVFILKPQTESYNVLKNLSRITMCPLIKTKNCVAYRPEIYEDNLLSLLKHENHTINSAVVLEFFSGQTLEEELLMNEGLNKKFKKFCELIDRHSKFSCKRNEKLQVDEKEATVAKIRSNEEKVMQSDTNKRISVKLDNMACGSLSNESPGEKYSYNIIPRLVNGSAQAKKHSEKLKEMIFRLKRTVGNSFVTIIFDHREFKNHSEDPPEHVIDFDPNIFASNVQSLFIIVAESQENCELYDVCAKFASHVYYRSDIIEEIFPPIKNCSRNRLMALLDNWVNNSNVLYKMNIRIRKTIHSHRKVLLQRLFESYKKNLEDTIKFDSISTIKINTSYSPLFPTLFLIHNENHKSGNSVASLLIISQNYLIINAIGSSYDRGIVFKRACLKSYNIIDSNIIMIVTKHGNIIQFCIQSSYNKIEKLDIVNQRLEISN
ncbi:MAG: hypothetical protein MHMPM18_001682 [Marteilia pararefringens]